MNAEPNPPDLEAIRSAITSRRPFSWEDAEALVDYTEALVAALREMAGDYERGFRSEYTGTRGLIYPLPEVIAKARAILPVVSPVQENPK